MTSLGVRARKHREGSSSYILDIVRHDETELEIDLDVCLAVCPTDTAYTEYAKETIECLGPDDTLTLFVIGGTNPKVLPRTSMDSHGKAIAKGAVSTIEPNEYVHLWDGLHACLRHAEIERPMIPGRLSVLVLVTSGRRTACPMSGEREELRKYSYLPTRNPCKLIVPFMTDIEHEGARLLYDLAEIHDRSGNEFADRPENLRRVLERTKRTRARNARIDVMPRLSFEADEVDAPGFPKDLIFGYQDLSQEIVVGDVFESRQAFVRLPRGLLLTHMDVLLEYFDPATGETKKTVGLEGPIGDPLPS
jgi:hypothetical protein